MNWIKEIFEDTKDFIFTLGNRASNKHTGKGLLILAIFAIGDQGLDIDTLETIFDGVESSPAQLIMYLGFFVAVNYIKKKE